MNIAVAFLLIGCLLWLVLHFTDWEDEDVREQRLLDELGPVDTRRWLP